MKNDRKIIIGIGLFFVVPLLVSILIIILSSINEKNTLKAALKPTVDEDIAVAISKRDVVNPENTILHEIAKSGDYVAVGSLSTGASDYGDGATIILKRKAEGYDVVYAGTGYGPETLTDLGVPASLVKRLTTGNGASYSEALSNSMLNPRNKYPIVKDLPFVSDSLTIDYYFKDNIKDEEGVNVPIISITGADAAERRNALSKIRSFGYDIGYFPIIFNNLNSPFSAVSSDWKKTIADSDAEDDALEFSDNGDDEEAP